eukprot:TRINITY_DN47030_c0_g1_i1.p1 TRINITY_DN47030_c0_g1~~TRINITY_DN47030_c0_g1_i1.p1  ORF type:complete len:311 (-),score=31.35 TRINITY_DN47030_c0_g1_i1:93-1001(-)
MGLHSATVRQVNCATVVNAATTIGIGMFCLLHLQTGGACPDRPEKGATIGDPGIEREETRSYSGLWGTLAIFSGSAGFLASLAGLGGEGADLCNRASLACYGLSTGLGWLIVIVAALSTWRYSSTCTDFDCGLQQSCFERLQISSSGIDRWTPYRTDPELCWYANKDICKEWPHPRSCCMSAVCKDQWEFACVVFGGNVALVGFSVLSASFASLACCLSYQLVWDPPESTVFPESDFVPGRDTIVPDSATHITGGIVMGQPTVAQGHHVTSTVVVVGAPLRNSRNTAAADRWATGGGYAVVP